jgi:Ribbon-helix-helix protein, copG family
MSKNRGTLVAVWLTPAELKQLDAHAKASRNTRSGIVRLALDKLLAQRKEVA